MGFFKPVIVTGGGAAIELADNLTTTTKGKALDARQGNILHSMIPDLSGYAKKADIPKVPNYTIINAGIKLPLHIELINVVTHTDLGSLDVVNGKIHSRIDLNSGQMYKLRITVTTSGISGLLFFAPMPNEKIDLGFGISSLTDTMEIPLICRTGFSGKDYNVGTVNAFIKE